jgi:hypothetical protein
MRIFLLDVEQVDFDNGELDVMGLGNMANLVKKLIRTGSFSS